jgi:hypothetical protein
MIRNLVQIAFIVGVCSTFIGQQTPAGIPPAAASSTATAEEPRLFITNSASWEMSGPAPGNNGTLAAQSRGSARLPNPEIIKTFGQRCSGVVINGKPELADYIVLLDHDRSKGYLGHKNKVAVFERLSGDVVVTHSTVSLGGSVEYACNAIGQHWVKHANEILAAKKTVPAAPSASLSLAPVSLPQLPQSSLVSISVESTPSGADIEIDAYFVGNTPSTIAVAPGTHEIAVKKKGFAAWTRKLSVSGGNIRLSAELEQVAGN